MPITIQSLWALSHLLWGEGDLFLARRTESVRSGRACHLQRPRRESQSEI